MPTTPQTCGKVERFHQTLKRCLDQQPAPATLAELQAQLDKFADDLQHPNGPTAPCRPRAPPPTSTPPDSKPTAGNRTADTHYRVRHDKVDKTGSVTMRYNGRLHHIGMGRPHGRTHVVLLIADREHIRVVHATTGELLRDLTIDTNRDYQPTGRPPGWHHNPK